MLKVLKPELLKQEICPGSAAGTFKSWNLKILDTQSGMPSKKILSYHAQKAVEWAETNEWISSDEYKILMTNANFNSPPEPPHATTLNWVNYLSDVANGKPPYCCTFQLCLYVESHWHCVPAVADPDSAQTAQAFSIGMTELFVDVEEAGVGTTEAVASLLRLDHDPTIGAAADVVLPAERVTSSAASDTPSEDSDGGQGMRSEGRPRTKNSSQGSAAATATPSLHSGLGCRDADESRARPVALVQGPTRQ